MPDEPNTRIEVACATAAPSDADSRFALMQALTRVGLSTSVKNIPEITDPITVGEAGNFVTSQLGVLSEFDIMHSRRMCWLRLIAARTPEQRLSLERLIDALGVGIGMCRHEEAARIIQNNSAAYEADRLQAAKVRDLNRWRGFGPETSAVAKGGVCGAART